MAGSNENSNAEQKEKVHLFTVITFTVEKRTRGDKSASREVLYTVYIVANTIRILKTGWKNPMRN